MNNLPSQLYETQPGVFYVKDPGFVIDDASLAFIKECARKSPKKQSRICLHAKPEAPVHEMIIVHLKDFYVRPHRHLAKTEGFTVIEGQADVVTFDDDGQLRDITRLGPAGSGNPYYMRMPPGLWHGLIIRSEFLLFHETSQGPFDPSQSEFALWAPNGTDQTAICNWLSALETTIRSVG